MILAHTLDRVPQMQSHVDMMVSQGIDTNKPGYRRGWQFMAQVAQGMGVDVDREDLAHWACNLGIMRAIDELVDKEHQPNVVSEVEALAQGNPIQGVTSQESQLFAHVIRSYPISRKQQHLIDLASFPYFANRRRQARNVRELVDVNLTEASMFARILSLEPEQLPTRDSRARRNFNHWVLGFSRVGYLLDSLIDLQDDKAAGNVCIPESNSRARLAIARVAIPEASRVLGQTPSRTFRSLVKISLLNSLEKAA